MLTPASERRLTRLRVGLRLWDQESFVHIPAAGIGLDG